MTKNNSNNSVVEYKRLKSKDYEIGSQAAKDFYKNKTGFKWMNDFLANRRNYFIVAILDERVIGFAIAYGLENWHKSDREALLYDIEVANKYRHQGVGTKLFIELKTILKKEGYAEIWLPTNTSNKPAMKFYQKLGGVRENRDDALFIFNLTGN